MSEQLKIERELFPACIQAPRKYYNKRKSFNDSQKKSKRKDQSTILPGERISSFENRKENSVNLVNKWLKKQEFDQPFREPLTNICANIPVRKNIRKNIKKSKKSYKENVQYSEANKPKFHSLTSPIINKSKYINKQNPNNSNFNKYSDESGIVIDDESIFEDSQSDLNKKDRLALLAVKVADDNCSMENKIPRSCETIKTYSNLVRNVPFYKKSNLSCKSYNTTNLTYEEEPQNMSVTIETNYYITTISVTQNITNNSILKRSVPVQTDISDIQGRDLLKLNECKNADCQPKPSIVIYDSSSDCDTTEILQVQESTSTQGVRSILSQLDQKLNCPTVKAARRLTPTSSNSSEKENLDPNRMKKRKVLVKEKKKKQHKL